MNILTIVTAVVFCTALHAASPSVSAVQAEAAAFMACGYAKFTGKLGVCLATSGPGGLHLLNGLYDAKLDGQPVLALTRWRREPILTIMALACRIGDRIAEMARCGD